MILIQIKKILIDQNFLFSDKNLINNADRILFVIDSIWFWVILVVLGIYLIVWLIFNTYKGIRYKIFQNIAFLLMVLSIAFYNISEYDAPLFMVQFGLYTALVAFSIIVLGVLWQRKRWINQRGITELTKFRNLRIYAYIRHPVTLGLILNCIALILINHSILSNLFAIMTLICFILSSVEKDIYLEELHGYPFRKYKETVPRFNIFLGCYQADDHYEEES